MSTNIKTFAFRKEFYNYFSKERSVSAKKMVKDKELLNQLLLTELVETDFLTENPNN